MNAKSGAGACDFGCSGFLEGRLSKNPPPPKGGGDTTCGAEGADLVGTDAANALVAVKEDLGCDCGRDDAVTSELGKLRPLKASVSPPNASCGCVTGGVIIPKEGCRLCG